uniref:Ubiquitin-like domain-containing protein n=1 Tax=Clytia hemisphaerica TaxID=252671 RepID=A0A7M5XC17_9CNID
MMENICLFCSKSINSKYWFCDRSCKSKHLENGFTFKLRFLTKEMELNSKDFVNIVEVKQRIQQEYKIHFHAQVILYNGLELENYWQINVVYLKMIRDLGQKQSKKELCLNLIINKKTLEIQVIPRIVEYESTIPLITLDSCTIGKIKETICKHMKEELKNPRFIHLEKEDGTFLEDEYQLKHYSIESHSKIYLKRKVYLRVYFQYALEIEHLEIFEYEGRTLYQVLKQIKVEHVLSIRISDKNVRQLNMTYFENNMDLSTTMSSFYDLQLKIGNLSPSKRRCILM